MKKVYILPVERIDNTDTVAGIEYIHNALLTYGAGQAILIQDTTTEEDEALSILATEVREPTSEELIAFEAIEKPLPPDPDYTRACELLSHSPDAIKQPEIWELLRLIGKRLGYRFD